MAQQRVRRPSVHVSSSFVVRLEPWRSRAGVASLSAPWTVDGETLATLDLPAHAADLLGEADVVCARPRTRLFHTGARAEMTACASKRAEALWNEASIPGSHRRCPPFSVQRHA